MSGQVTDWFPANVRPALSGWYDVRYVDRVKPYFKRRYFDGETWRFHPESSACLFGNNSEDAPREAWRGLAENPAGQEGEQPTNKEKN
jgi:hypothetical protein